MTQDRHDESGAPRRHAWQCNCPCHKAPLSVVHPVPCCEPCPFCGKTVARGQLALHLDDCKRYCASAEVPGSSGDTIRNS